MKKRNSMPLREVIDEELYLELLNQPKGEKQRELHFFRFKIFLVVSRHTGLGVSDVGTLTKEQIKEMIKNGKLSLKEKKTGKYRIVLLSEKAVEELSMFEQGIDVIFENQSTLMGTNHNANWIRFVNKGLKGGVQGLGKYVRSHSMRATYITHLLKHYPLHEVSKIVNHSSVTITERYFRYHPDSEKLQKVLSLL